MSPHQDSQALRRIRFVLSGRRRWFIIGLISLVALINYFDRQSLSVVAPRFQAELHLSDEGYGHVVSLFLLASAFSYLGAGFITDWLGTRASMALFVGWWSIAEAVTAFVRSATQLAAARFCLGLGEPGLWVAAPKAVGETIEEKHHSLAIGVYTLGATVGAVIALPAIAAVTAHLPWKSIFIIDGCAGILWLPLWFSAFPRERRAAAAPCAVAANAAHGSAFKDVLARGKTWKLMIARGLTDPVWYFYLFWYPKYLLGPRGLPLARVAHIGWMVYLFAGVGTLVGGVFSGWLIRRGIAPVLAYRRSMIFCAVLIPLSPFAGLAPSPLISVSIASIIALAHMAWLITLSSTVIALFPPLQLGKAFGLIAAGSAFGGLLSTEVIANVVTRHGYLPVFFLMMLMHPLALALLWTTFREKAADPATA
ncbi:MAG TPA: MFS transporter [Terracidiphilus sp.]|nr:MFS transporter [Terracidiphilus sp.]